MKSELVTASHLARKAIVYIRQSTPAQVVTNQESLRLQYALRHRAEELGWRRTNIDVIDADLGLSGASSLYRRGFQELTARVSLSEVGLVLSVDVTRLARNCSDWYPLLDICGLRDCLIADRDGVYDPSTANGRLLLGLKGTISELELHTIRSRLTGGLLAKAERGELAQMLPVGLVREAADVVVKDPNVEVQQRLGMVFDSFLRLRSAAKVMRLLLARGLDLPRRDRHGDLHWVRGTVSAVAAILKNPAYAGAFVFGRKRTERLPGGGRAHKSTRSRDQWRIVVKDRYPAYIDWTTFEVIEAILHDNRAEYMTTKTRGAPREGQLLLQGIAWCARCGHKMYVRYQHGGEYVCNHLHIQRGDPVCQHMSAGVVDEAVAQAFLTALAPAEIEMLSRAQKARRQADTALRNAAEQQVARKRYQASLAERQYNKVDPDNRLVAAELERRWEAALDGLRTAEEALSRQDSAGSPPPPALSKTMGDKVVALAGRLPLLWADPATRDADRKALLRCLVEKVVLDRGERDTAMVRIVWRGGEVSELAVRRPVTSIASLERGEEMKRRALDLSKTTMPDIEIAALLTAEGHRSPKNPTRVLPDTVRRIRKQAGWPARKPCSRWRHASGSIGIAELASRLGIPTKWLYVQIRDGRIRLDCQPTGAYLVQDCQTVLQAVRNLRNHEIETIDLRAHQPGYREHPHG
ncbi:recombinase family protein [Aurantimonas sp. A2-1-M11]|uniref:recombinase family protein n=1 Tax=Aurantimonas sp. A2-1-M11 TaxID=3113712 RepID=UPI002F936B32